MTDSHGAPPEVFYTAGGVSDPNSQSSADLDMARQAIEFFFEQFVIGLQQWVGDQVPALGEVWEILTGTEDADSGDAASWVNALLGRGASLAGRVTRIENKIAIGAEFYDDFNRGDNDSALGNGWVQGGDGQGLGIHDQAAQVKRDALPDDGTRYAIAPQVASGDDFTVAAVIHPAGVSANPETVLYARANTAFTAGVCVRFRSGLTRISRWTRSGVAFSYTDVGPAGTKFYSNSATCEFKGSGTALQCVIDGVLVVDTTDAVHTIGAANRTVGFSAQCWTAILAIPQYSGGLASFALRSSVELTAVAAATTAATAAQSAAANAEQLAVDNSAAISELQSGISGETGGSGYSYAYPFDGSALDADWTTYDPNGTGTVVSGGQVEPGDAATGNVFHLFETALPGDDFEVSFTLGSNNAHSSQCTGLLFAANTTLTDFARIYTFDNEIYLGRSTRPSSTSNAVTTYDWASNTSQSFSAGKICRVRKVGTNYKVWVGGSLAFNHTHTAGDPGGLKATGASYRWTGIQQEYDSALFAGKSAGVAHFTVADYTTPTFTGTGWKISRLSSSNSTQTSWTSAGAALHTSAFDSTDKVAGNCTVENLGLGRIRVTQAGTYWISVGVEFGSGTAQAARWIGVAANSTSPPSTVVGRSPDTEAGHAHATTGSTGSGGSDFHTHSSGGISATTTVAGSPGVFWSGPVDLAANDYIQVLGGGSSVNTTVRGDGAGVKTYFSGVRVG